MKMVPRYHVWFIATLVSLATILVTLFLIGADTFGDNNGYWSLLVPALSLIVGAILFGSDRKYLNEEDLKSYSPQTPGRR